MCGWDRNQLGRSAKQFVCGTRTLAVDAPGVCGQVGMFPFGPGFFGSLSSFPFVSFLLVVAQLEHRGGGLHSQFDDENG